MAGQEGFEPSITCADLGRTWIDRSRRGDPPPQIAGLRLELVDVATEKDAIADELRSDPETDGARADPLGDTLGHRLDAPVGMIRDQWMGAEDPFLEADRPVDAGRAGRGGVARAGARPELEVVVSAGPLLP